MLNKDHRYPSVLLFCESTIFYRYKTKNSDEVIKRVHETRYKERCVITEPKIHETVSQRTYFFLGNRFFNLLPTEIKSVTTFYSSKRKLKQCIYSKKRQKS